MNSEKVKEIKEKLKEHYYYLDQAYSDYLAYGGKADEQQEEKIHFFGDILTLINELESENERLKIQLEQANAGIVNCSGCKLVEINAVRAFAEKLKSKMLDREYYGIHYKWGAFSGNDIDELLKEYEVEE